MARFEKLQDLFGIFCRTRETRSLASLCDEMNASQATVKRLISFLRDQRGVDIRYDREQGGYRLERSPDDPNAAVLLGLTGREISALLEAEALLEQIPPGFVRDETEVARSRLGKVRRQAFGKGDLKDRVRLRMSQLRSTSADAFATVLAALRSRRRLEFVYRSRSRDEEKSRVVSPRPSMTRRQNMYRPNSTRVTASSPARPTRSRCCASTNSPRGGSLKRSGILEFAVSRKAMVG